MNKLALAFLVVANILWTLIGAKETNGESNPHDEFISRTLCEPKSAYKDMVAQCLSEEWNVAAPGQRLGSACMSYVKNLHCETITKQNPDHAQWVKAQAHKVNNIQANPDKQQDKT